MEKVDNEEKSDVTIREQWEFGWKLPSGIFFAVSFPAFRTYFLIIIRQFQGPDLLKCLYDVILYVSDYLVKIQKVVAISTCWWVYHTDKEKDALLNG